MSGEGRTLNGQCTSQDHSRTLVTRPVPTVADYIRYWIEDTDVVLTGLITFTKGEAGSDFKCDIEVKVHNHLHIVTRQYLNYVRKW